MSIANNKQSKRRKTKAGHTGGDSESTTHPGDTSLDIMKLKPEDQVADASSTVVLTNGHVCDTKNDQEVECPAHVDSDSRCLRCHKGCSNTVPVKERNAPTESNVLPTVAKNSQASLSPPTSSYKGPKACDCKMCVDRRSLEAETLLETQMRHAWTQIRHLVRCAYHDPLVLAAIDSDEFKSYVNLLVSQDPHLLFQRVESQSREYVNDVKSRLLKQLRTGFNTPQLACTYVNMMFEEYGRLLASARTLSSLLRQLEEEHLSHFNNVTLEQHSMHLFQCMVYSEAYIQRALNEILLQLRSGSNQHEESNNIFTNTLIKYLKFDTEMTQVSVAWRDIQKMMDDFNDERVDAKRMAKENCEEYTNHWNYTEQLNSPNTTSQQQHDHKLSLTLRQCTCAKPHTPSMNCPHCEQQAEKNTKVEDQTNQEESRHDHDCEPFLLPNLHGDYLSNIKPPSVPSDDLEDSSDNSGPPKIIEHPSLVVPSDLDEELDSIGSPSPQACANFSHNPFLHFDGTSNNLFLNPPRPFIPLFSPSAAAYSRNFQHFRKNHTQDNELLFADGMCQWPMPPFSKGGDSLSDTEPRDKYYMSLSPPAISSDNNGDAPNVSQPKGETSSPAESTTTTATIPTSTYSTQSETLTKTCTHKNATSLNSCNSSSTCRMTASTCATMSDGLCKDSWSSSSSASFGSASTLNFSDYGWNKISKFKSTKLRRKTHRKTRSSQRSNESLTQKKDQDAKSRTPSSGNNVDGENRESSRVQKADEDCEVDEDADDEYDGEEDEEQMCKCDKCLATINNTFSSFADPKPYLMPSMDGNTTGQCECSSCVRLAAVSFFAAQSNQPSHSLGGYSPNDVAGGNPIPSQFYNPVQDLHIHPHLYGLPAMGNPSMGTPTSESHHSNTSDVTTMPPSDKLGEEKSSVLDPPHLFHQTPTSNEWDIFGKMSTGVSDKNSMSQAQNLPEWTLAHPAWLNGGHPSAIIKSNLLNPGTLSAIQQILSGNNLQGFLQQPFANGPMPTPYSNIIPSSSYLTKSTNESLFPQASSVSMANSSSFVSTTTMSSSASSQTSQQTSSSSSCSFDIPLSSPPNITTTKHAPSVNGSLDQQSVASSSIFAPTSTINYFSSSVYPQVPDFTSIPSSAFMPSLSQAAMSETSSMHGSQQVQPIRFHPGTSVSLKENQFSIGAQGGKAGGGGNLFIPPIMSAGHLPTSQHNPFQQHFPNSAAPSLATDFSSQASSAAPVTVGQNPILTPYPGGIPTTTGPPHNQPQIMRRKKLVAQSKLSKQGRPSQSNNVSPSAGSQVVQTSMQVSMQKGQSSTKVTLSASQKIQAAFPSQVHSQPQHQTDNTRTPPDLNDKDLSKGKTPHPVSCQADVKKPAPPPAPSVPNNPEHPPTISAPPGDQCHHAHGPGGHGPSDTANSSTNTTNGNNGSGNGSNYKYCNCCYCEFFGNGGPQQAPTSKNYPEIRDRLRKKLIKSKDPKDHDPKLENGDCVHHESSSPASHTSRSPESLNRAVNSQRTVEELLSFIEGTSEERSKKSAKRARQKQKKEIDKSKPESVDHSSNLHEKSVESREVVITSSEADGGRSDKNAKKKKKKPGAKGDELTTEEKIAENSSPVDPAPKSKIKEAKTKGSFDSSFKIHDDSSTPTDQQKESVKIKTTSTSKSQDAEAASSSAANLKKSGSSTKPPLKHKTSDKSESSVNSDPHKGSSVDKQLDHAESSAMNQSQNSNNMIGSPVDPESPSDEIAASRVIQSRQLSLDELKVLRQRPRKYLVDQNEKNRVNWEAVKLVNERHRMMNVIHIPERGVVRKDINFPYKSEQGESEQLKAEEKVEQQVDGDSAVNTSAGSTPEKGNDNEGENLKNKTRKQRRKNRSTNVAPPGEKGVGVDQVFLPREEIENENEMDAAEKEIESFKRFCMDSTVLNKPKKITVNWKDVTFKKNLSTH